MNNKTINRIIGECSILNDAIEIKLERINQKLSDFLDDHSACIFNQSGDGWVILSNSGLGTNTPVSSIDFDKLFKMTRDDAIKYLVNNAI